MLWFSWSDISCALCGHMVPYDMTLLQRTATLLPIVLGFYCSRGRICCRLHRLVPFFHDSRSIEVYLAYLFTLSRTGGVGNIDIIC